jgi:integrase
MRQRGYCEICLAENMRSFRAANADCRFTVATSVTEAPRGVSFFAHSATIGCDLLTVRISRHLQNVTAQQRPRHMENVYRLPVTPQTEKRTVRNRRPPNAALRTREYLTPQEVNALVEAARKNPYGHCDATMILIAYRHGLRASELCGLRWEQVDLRAANLHVSRVKIGTPSTHPLKGVELRAPRRLQCENPPGSPFVFLSERKAPFSVDGFRHLVQRAAGAGKLEIKCHPHMLRHACGFILANDGVDTRSLQSYLGHRNIQHTVRYTELAPTRFKDFWRD